MHFLPGTSFEPMVILTAQTSRLHCSTFRIMCDVPSITVFFSEPIECFPGKASKFFLKLLVTIPVTQITTGIIVRIIIIIIMFLLLIEFSHRTLVYTLRNLSVPRKVIQKHCFTLYTLYYILYIIYFTLHTLHYILYIIYFITYSSKIVKRIITPFITTDFAVSAPIITHRLLCICSAVCIRCRLL